MTRKFTESRILIATHNAGKLDEMRQLFARLAGGLHEDSERVSDR